MEMEFFPRFDVSRDGKSGNEFMFFFFDVVIGQNVDSFINFATWLVSFCFLLHFATNNIVRKVFTAEHMKLNGCK